MIISYSASLQGSSHVKKGAICQDANKIVTLNNGWVVAAIADGIGSSAHSEVAARIAVEAVANYFLQKTNLEWQPDLIKVLLPEAFENAQKNIEEYAVLQNHEFYDYDTTLDVVIYNGKGIAFGHSGDGGIVGLTKDGDYIPVTRPQKGEDGYSVIPLRAGRNYWEFNSRNTLKFASVLLATDGVYDTFFPYLLKGQPVEVYVPLIRFFMDNGILKANENNIGEIKDSRIKFLRESCPLITDDKTLAILINPDTELKEKPCEFYAEPDWDKLSEEWMKKVYPYLQKLKKAEMPKEDVKAETPEETEKPAQKIKQKCLSNKQNLSRRRNPV
jgi:Serine/threonine protein phosphatase